MVIVEGFVLFVFVFGMFDGLVSIYLPYLRRCRRCGSWMDTTESVLFVSGAFPFFENPVR